MSIKKHRGYTLIELIVAVGLFALVMLLASGAYFMMISVSRQAQGISTGINNLSFALETMTRTIRTGKNYSCNGAGDCPNGGTAFSMTDANNNSVAYASSNGVITQNGIALTDPTVNITSLTFYVAGTQTVRQGDFQQPHVTIIVTGTVSYAAGKSQTFSIETGATMRGSDL